MLSKIILIILCLGAINLYGFVNEQAELLSLSASIIPVLDVQLPIEKNKAKEVNENSVPTHVIDTLLVENFEEIDEVVEIGYGQVKKSDLVGAVNSLNNEDIIQKSLNNPIESLQGSLAGVRVQSSTGRLGDPFQITIRGNNTLINDIDDAINGTTIGGVSSPLFIVDGVYSDGIDFNFTALS